VAKRCSFRDKTGEIHFVDSSADDGDDRNPADGNADPGLSRHSSAPATLAILGVNLMPICADRTDLAGYTVS
jgi:hypothetical protein